MLIAGLVISAALLSSANSVLACNTCGCCRVEGFSDAEYLEVGQSRAEASDSTGKGADALPIDPGSWTLVVMPDTQHYSETAAYLPHFKAQTQWIVDHEESHNIKYVLHEGRRRQRSHSNPAMGQCTGRAGHAQRQGALRDRARQPRLRHGRHGEQSPVVVSPTELLRAGNSLRHSAQHRRLLRSRKDR